MNSTLETRPIYVRTREHVEAHLKAFGIDVPAKIYTKGDLRELKSAIDPF